MRVRSAVTALGFVFAAQSGAALEAKIEQVANGLDLPWSIGFLPQGDVLVTEKPGRLWRVAPDGTKREVLGLPETEHNGQGGLLDVVVARDFDQSGEIFLSYAKQYWRGQGTVLAVAKLDGDRLTDVRVLFEMRRAFDSPVHFGGRIAEGPDGLLYLSIGDRGDGPSAQDRSTHRGSIIRVDRRGKAASGNPEGGRKEIYSYGHRNPQGLAFDSQGQLWAHEHGAKGGDEINKITAGANYGWPVIAYGVNYNGSKIGEGTKKEGMEQPVYYWDPSIAPSGLAIHSGKGWPELEGKFLIGSLKFDYIAVMSADGRAELDQVKTRETGRVRDVREGPDGAVWFLSEDNGALYRMTAK